MSSSLFLGFSRSFDSIAASCSYSSSISARRLLVRVIASMQFSMKLEISSNYWISSWKASTNYCSVARLSRWGRLERMDSSWMRVNSSEDWWTMWEISLVTLMRS